MVEHICTVNYPPIHIYIPGTKINAPVDLIQTNIKSARAFIYIRLICYSLITVLLRPPSLALYSAESALLNQAFELSPFAYSATPQLCYAILVHKMEIVTSELRSDILHNIHNLG